MPLIRYRIGDTGMWSAEPCPCGRIWPLLARVTGRTVDAFLTPHGALVGGEYFFGCLEGYEWLERFQLVQQSVDEVDVFLQLFAGSGELDPDRREQIVSMIRRAMGEKCVVNVHVVPNIQSMPSGKYLSMVSKVRSQEEARR
jgi:phenylacetate-CoA ligase